MNVTNYQLFDAPASHHALVENIKDFAVAQGWTLDEWQEGVQWAWNAGAYAWLAGTENFFQIHSHGSGGVYIGYRMHSKTANLYSYSNVRKIMMASFKSTEASYSTASGTSPCVQGTSSYRVSDYDYNQNATHLHTSDPTFSKQYCFGSSTFIHSIVQYDVNYAFHIFFGMPEMLKAASGDICMEIRHGASVSENYYTAPIITSLPGSAVDWNSMMFYLNGTQYYNSSYLMTQNFLSRLYWTDNGTDPCGISYNQAILPNTFAMARPLFRDMVFIDDGGIRKAIAYLPWAWCSPSGLQFAQELDYSAETYMVFPVSFTGVNSFKKCIAYRIA